MTDPLEILRRHAGSYAPVVPFLPGRDGIFAMDMTSSNPDLTPEWVADTERFSAYMDAQRKARHARYAIGGYGEHRTLYGRSTVFDGAGEPRRFHLGLDIWGDAGTPVHAPLEGTVHSFAYHGAFGDYGAAIILQHALEGITFYSLYGHLSLTDLQLEEGQRIGRGQAFAHFGIAAENGSWPPHLHLQLILDMDGKKGDYPGVCRYSERERYLANCPDPDLVCRLSRYL